MQAVQRKFGRDKFEVLLLSVDAAYEGSVASATDSVKKTVKYCKVDWQAAVEPNGWKGVNKTWKVDGYQWILLDRQGKVVTCDESSDDLELDVKRLLN